MWCSFSSICKHLLQVASRLSTQLIAEPWKVTEEEIRAEVALSLKRKVMDLHMYRSIDLL